MAFTDVFRASSLRQELELSKARVSEMRLERDLLQKNLAEASAELSRLNGELKTVLEDRDRLRQRLGDAVVMDMVILRDKSDQLRKEISTASLELDRKNAENKTAEAELEEKKKLLTATDDALLLQEFGLYEPKYKLTTVSEYKARLDHLRVLQASMARDGSACAHGTKWEVNGSSAQGSRMVREFTKLIVRAFNTECDDTIERVKFFNIDASRKRIEKSFALLNRLGSQMQIRLTFEYLSTKIMELELAFEFQLKKQEEKEEQRKLREKMREDLKLQREIDTARESLIKEERHFRRALTQMEERLANATMNADRTLLESEIALIQEKIAEVGIKRQNVDYRAQNARAGYVYVISNLGAFGEGIFKIGVTRRLEPLDRIDELGDASVPFDFDVHALVFSDDAYGLEAALHRHFSDYRLNMINGRKEFFRAGINEIEEVLRENFAKPVEFIKVAEAAEYRQSLRLGAPQAPQPVEPLPTLALEEPADVIS
jgi:hypothetical protein